MKTNIKPPIVPVNRRRDGVRLNILKFPELEIPTVFKCF